MEARPTDGIRVVSESPDVFPDDLPGMPPERDIEFSIDLLPSTAPIAKRPYHMAPTEHEEVKKTIDELLAKGYIRRSFSPWAFPLLLVDKKDGSKRMCHVLRIFLICFEVLVYSRRLICVRAIFS